jgi:hypothetical protein
MRPAYRMISPKDGRSHREFSVDLALLSIRECILVGFVRGPDQKKGKLKKPQERKKGGFITLETNKENGNAEDAKKKRRRQECPRARARPADACAEPYHCATWHCRRTAGCSFRCGRAGHPRPLSTGVVDRRWQPADMIYSQGRGESGHDEKRRHNVCPYPRACHTTAC